MDATPVGSYGGASYSEVEVDRMPEALVIKSVLALILGLLLGAILGGWMGMPWWFVFPIALVGGLGIGMA